ncbi:hypothetical protein MYCTH_111172 [Thermothelomyces thermophilus ATCC 42464]|uniref:Uncharacterized protein n=1 Tax=Thermothelomyces thermophilus (strain ATCC 42464 / BCRC 31852 / DSM 1799) TaxID=573729 RepID=G2Q8G6_THET4|nr:uncharacterized protein MYCTH_111172 [Thermothelomyces thermophilus ATCC 42464]AEO56215.1 hypothetical protein MYCTH_111172 [Thermothelomyces thermophilus ATCC 42464]
MKQPKSRVYKASGLPATWGHRIWPYLFLFFSPSVSCAQSTSSDQAILVSLVSYRSLQPLVGVPGRFILLVYPLDTRCLLSPEWSGDGEISFGGRQDVSSLVTALEGASLNAAAGAASAANAASTASDGAAEGGTSSTAAVSSKPLPLPLYR